MNPSAVSLRRFTAVSNQQRHPLLTRCIKQELYPPFGSASGLLSISSPSTSPSVTRGDLNAGGTPGCKARSRNTRLHDRLKSSLVVWLARKSAQRCVTQPRLLVCGGRFGSPVVAVRRRRRTFQIRTGWAVDARRHLGTVVVTTESLDAHRAWERFGTIVVAARRLDAANRRQRFGTIVVAASFANTVWNTNPVQDLVTEVGGGQRR